MNVNVLKTILNLIKHEKIRHRNVDIKYYWRINKKFHN